MADELPRDLTRWNRAGLARVAYVDGNAAVFLERLRVRLREAFPDWPAARPYEGDGSVVLDARARLEGGYAADPDDMLWQINRACARAAHVLAASLDATANEGWIGTATQWESLRRLTAMLDYAPHPPASAFTSLALEYKPAQAGKLPAGFQVRHNPADGGKPIVFETLEEFDGDAALNALRPLDFDRNPAPLSGARLTLAGRHDKIKTGEPLVLEDERPDAHGVHRLQAHLIVGVDSADDRTSVDISPPVGRADGFLRGHTLVHLAPKDRLAVFEPRTTGAQVGRSLRLTAPPEGLRAGDIVVIARNEAKPLFRRVKEVRDSYLVFYADLGEVDLANATVMTPLTVPIAHLGGNRRGIRASAGGAVRTLHAAGDWGWLSGRWLADVRHEGQPVREYLPLYECVKANYFPPSATTSDGSGPNPLAGYTALTLVWLGDRDRADDGPDLGLDNPQSLLTAPRTAGPWRPDTFLQKSQAGRLAEPVVVGLPKRTAPGDIAVLVRGGVLAWARLKHVGVDAEAGRAALETLDGWQDRGGGPFFLAATRLHAHFDDVARPLDATRNDTPLHDGMIPLAERPAALRVGRRIVADNGSAALATTVAELGPPEAPAQVRLLDPLPAGSTAGNLVLRGNVVPAGHGEAKPLKVLGSGNAAINHQRFLLDVKDASFVADPAMPGGVRADLVVSVSGEQWLQVGNLGDSRPTDAHYQVRQNEDGQLWVEFGDGRHGRRLPTGGNNVLVRYRQGVGPAGNLPAGSLAKPVHPQALVAAVTQPVAASGGGDREAPQALRENASRALLTLERAVTLADFAALARGNAGIAQAEAFSLPAGRGQRENIEVVVVPAGGGSFTTSLRDSVQAYLLAHSLPGVQLTVSAYDALRFGLHVTVRVRREAFDPELVKEAVRSTLAAAFALERRRLGQALYRGEVYGVVEAVTGVENSDVGIDLDGPTAAALRRLAQDARGEVLSALPQPRQCLHLDPDPARLVVVVEDFFL